MATLETVISRTVINAIANCHATTLGGTLRAVYDAQYQDQIGIANATPALQVVSADVEAVATGDGLQVMKDGASMPINFIVRQVQPDGRGITVLVLESA